MSQPLIQSSIQFPKKLDFLLTQKSRYKVTWGGRGGAKSWGIARALLIKAAQQKLRILCVRELQTSLRDSVHKLLSDQIEAMGLSSLYVVERERIYCITTGSEFAFEGIRNNVTKIKSYEGIDICWAEEAEKITEDSWLVLTPTIRKEGSEIWISFNPNLRTDYTWKNFVVTPRRDSIVVKMSWRDNPFFPKVLEAEMQEMKETDYDNYLHVWEGECKRSLTGAVYAEELRAMSEQGRVCEVLHNPTYKVDCYWDLGRSDATTIWMYQFIAGQRRIIDYYENSLKPLEHYLDTIFYREGNDGQTYDFGIIGLPHDAEHKRLGQKLSIKEQVKQYFAQKGVVVQVKIVPKMSIYTGIMAARAIFPTCYFDTSRTDRGRFCLESYHYEENADYKTLSREPVHDWSSHAADAFRYFAIGSSNFSGEAKARRISARLREAGEMLLGRAPGRESWMG